MDREPRHARVGACNGLTVSSFVPDDNANHSHYCYQTGGRRHGSHVGDALRRHRRAILALQWVVVGFYALLVLVPALLPLPPVDASIVTNLTLFAQFAFWGIWWPFVIASTMVLGRAWCGLLCPEGTLTEFASRHGLGRSIPRWDALGRMAVLRLRADDDLRSARQRLRVSESGAAGARGLDDRGHCRRLRLACRC
jgi:hypothetical protein